MTTSLCELHKYHAPAAQGVHRHHVIPKAWTMVLGLPESRLVRICPTGHDNVHRDLRAALKGLPYRTGTSSQFLIDEPVAFYQAHPAVQDQLRALAEELIGD